MSASLKHVPLVNTVNAMRRRFTVSAITRKSSLRATSPPVKPTFMHPSSASSPMTSTQRAVGSSARLPAT